MDLFSMQCFLSAAEHLNLSKAAVEMHITQPAMSAQIKKLEQEIGASLFERDSRRLVLSPAGRIVQESFESMVGTYNIMRWKVEALEKKDKCLRVGYHGPVNWAGITDFFQSFLKEYPEISIRIVTGEYGELARKVEEGQLDVAFLEAAEYKNYSSIQWEFLFDDYGAFAMSKNHPLAGKTIISREDLQGQMVYFNLRDSDSMHGIMRKLIQSGIAQENLVCVEGTTTSIILAVANGGLAAVPMRFKERSNENVVYVNQEGKAVHMRFGLIWKKDQETEQLRQFVQHAKTHAWSAG